MLTLVRKEIPALAFGVVLGALLLFVVMPAHSAENGNAYADNSADGSDEPPLTVSAGIDPSTALYWFDILFERIGIWLADGAAEEVPLLLQYADEKLAEAGKLAVTDPQAAAEASERYELYLEEAVKKAQGAQKDGEDVDELLQEISRRSLVHVEALIYIGYKAATWEQPYIEEAFNVIEEQQKEVIILIQDEEKRKQTIETVLTYLQEQREKIPPEVEENIRATLEMMISNISRFILTEGEIWFDILSDSVKAYIETRSEYYND